MKLDKIAMDEYKEIMHSEKQDFLNPNDPYVNGYIIKCGRKKLAVIGGRHRADDKLIFGLMEKAFKVIKPKVVLLEQPKDHSVESLKEGVKHTSKKSWVEFHAATDLAVRNKVDIYLIDISDKENFEFFMHMKDGIKLYILELFSVIYNSIFHTYNKTRMIEHKDYKMLSESFTLRDIINDEQIYNAFIKVKQKEYKSIGLIAAIDKIIEETTKKYTGKTLTNDLLLSRALTAPFPYSNYEINRKVNAKHEVIRDSIMLHSVINHLKKADSVMFVCGSSHAFIMRKYLLKEISKFGKCTLEAI